VRSFSRRKKIKKKRNLFKWLILAYWHKHNKNYLISLRYFHKILPYLSQKSAPLALMSSELGYIYKKLNLKELCHDYFYEAHIHSPQNVTFLKRYINQLIIMEKWTDLWKILHKIPHELATVYSYKLCDAFILKMKLGSEEPLLLEKAKILWPESKRISFWMLSYDFYQQESQKPNAYSVESWSDYLQVAREILDADKPIKNAKILFKFPHKVKVVQKDYLCQICHFKSLKYRWKCPKCLSLETFS